MANDMKTLRVVADNGTFSFPVVDQPARNAAAAAQNTADSALSTAQSASQTAGSAQQTASAAQATAQAAKQAAEAITIPTALPNPFKLIFTGGATGEYDGSRAVTINIPTGGEGGGGSGGGSGSGPVQYVESLDESNLANLRDLTTGTYVLYGYFVPFAGSSDILTCDNTLVSAAHLSAGSHVLVFNPLNCKVNFIEILVDESAGSGFTYSVQLIDMRDLPALIEAVGSRNSLTTEDKSTVVAAINEVAGIANSKLDADKLQEAIDDALAQAKASGEFQGEKGEKGDTGDTGPQGPKGADGTGVTILGSYSSAEELAAQHPTGNPGDSYLVNGHLYVWSATTNAWEDVGNIQGPAGADGAKGEKGDTGEKGDKGDKGDTGEQGPQGIQGETGPTGPQGEQGIQGPKGDTGEQGPEGPQGPQGIQGEKGADGYTPVKGVDYFDGQDGEQGPAGPQGEKGDKGDTGPQGPQGEKGDTGETGPQGPAGADGAKGDKGDKGDTGAAGYTPQRGTDYWTSSDIAEIKSYVDEAILGGAW